MSSYVDHRPIIIEEPSKHSDMSSAFSTSMSYRNTSSSIRSSEKEDLAALIETKLPSLPFTYWQSKAKGKEMRLNSSCAKMPDLLNLRFNALYWQQLVASNLTIYFYGAYLDHTSYLSFFLHGQNFWKMKFTPKNANFLR